MVRAAGDGVTFVHDPAPFCMDDFRAATDLEP
jgi:hypothetical protein